jgi:lysozyme family protein
MYFKLLREFLRRDAFFAVLQETLAVIIANHLGRRITDMAIQQLIDAVIAREGGYVDHPADKGGPTRFGITQATARANGYQGDMQAFPREEAVRIYHLKYWEKPMFDRVAAVAPKIAEKLFETGISFLKRALNVFNRNATDYPDCGNAPGIDDLTITSLRGFIAKRKAAGELVLLKAINALQGERYISIAGKNPTQEAFAYGWIANRIS